MTATSTAGPGVSRRRPLRRPGVPVRLLVDGRRSGGTSAAWVDAARAGLLQQRAFRVKQLEELSDLGPGETGEAAPDEIRVALRVAAESVLVDVDAALRRIERGTYGRCQNCGGAISLTRLDAVPSAPLCGTCHRALEFGRQRGSSAGPLPRRPSTRR